MSIPHRMLPEATKQTLTNGICARGIFLSRKLDDVGF
jgi:hypothetical protein